MTVKYLKSFLQELADFEKMPDGPKIDEKGKAVVQTTLVQALHVLLMNLILQI